MDHSKHGTEQVQEDAAVVTDVRCPDVGEPGLTIGEQQEGDKFTNTNNHVDPEVEHVGGSHPPLGTAGDVFPHPGDWEG